VAKPRFTKARLLRLTASDDKLIRQWAREHGVSEAAVLRDLIRQERVRRAWADRDNMAQRWNAQADRAPERAA